MGWKDIYFERETSESESWKDIEWKWEGKERLKNSEREKGRHGKHSCAWGITFSQKLIRNLDIMFSSAQPSPGSVIITAWTKHSLLPECCRGEQPGRRMSNSRCFVKWAVWLVDTAVTSVKRAFCPQAKEQKNNWFCASRIILELFSAGFKCQGYHMSDTEINTCRAKCCSLFSSDHLSRCPCRLQVQRRGVSETAGLHGHIQISPLLHAHHPGLKVGPARQYSSTSANGLDHKCPLKLKYKSKHKLLFLFFFTFVSFK